MPSMLARSWMRSKRTVSASWWPIFFVSIPAMCRCTKRRARSFLANRCMLKLKRNSIRANARRVGANASILFYMGVHDVDAMQWVARSRIIRVYAQKIEELNHGNEDALYAVVNFENGAIGCIDYSWAWPDGLMNGFKSSLEIVGTRSGAFLDCAEQGLYQVLDDRTVGGDTYAWPEINGRIVGDLGDEIAHFAAALETGRPFVQHYREAFDAIPVLDALRESSRTGAVVNVQR